MLNWNICIDTIDMLDCKFSISFPIYHHFPNTTICYMCGYLFISGPHTGVMSVQNYGHLIFRFLNGKEKKISESTSWVGITCLSLGINSCTLKEDPQMNWCQYSLRKDNKLTCQLLKTVCADLLNWQREECQRQHMHSSTQPQV